MTANTPEEISDVTFLKQTKMPNMTHTSTYKLTNQYIYVPHSLSNYRNVFIKDVVTRHSFQLAYKVSVKSVTTTR